MIIQILKKDLLKRKGINIILFVFITLATVFLSSSVNNIMIVNTAVEYYMDYANVPDVNVLVNGDKEKKQIETWMEQKKEEGLLTAYAYDELLLMNDKAIQLQQGNKVSEIDENGVAVYLGCMEVEYSKVYNEQGETFQLKQGEIALPTNVMERNHLKVGDHIFITTKGKKQDFVIKVSMKDAMFGNDMVGMVRFIVHKEDYKQINTSMQMGLYYINTKDSTTLINELNLKSYSTVINTVNKDVYRMVYSFDMIIAALLILIGICLILIALLVLRFTLVFTMEEIYQEIGILKAIGLRDFTIKKLYLVKYLVLVCLGAVIGCILSIPVSEMMLTSVSNNLIMQQANANPVINFICAGTIITIVLLFCYLCTHKQNKVTAITAIRGGETGERYHARRGITLVKQRNMPVFFYLGLNDICTHLRRYIVLIVTFCISFLLITIPLNTLNTMKSNEMADKFLLNPHSAAYVKHIEINGQDAYTNSDVLKKEMRRLQSELEEKGYQVTLSAAPLYFFNYTDTSEKAKLKIMTAQPFGDDLTFLNYAEGKAPMLENEIAFSKDILRQEGWKIGDYILLNLNNEAKIMLITGTYSDYMQLGKSARLNPILNLNQETIFDYNKIMVNLDNEMTQVENVATLKKQFPDYEWLSAQEAMNQSIGGIQEALETMLIPMTAMLCAIIMLITLLMEKLFLVREKGEIAMMKSVGFSYKTLRQWQITRMILVVFTAMFIAVPLSFISNIGVLKPIFKIMGAEVAIQVDPIQVYLIYPAILLTGIILAVAWATRGMKHIHIKEINNLE